MSDEQRMSETLYAPDIEQAVLGLMLNQPLEVMEEVIARKLDEADFFIPAHKVLFRGMLYLYQKEDGIDMGLLHQWLVDRKEEKNVGSPGIFAELGRTAVINNLLTYFRRLKEKRLLREFSSVLKAAERNALDMPESVASLIDQTLHDVEQVGELISVESEADFGMEVQEAGLSIIEHADSGGGMKGLPTGFKKMDEITLGWAPGQLIIIGARPGLGKSALALAFAATVCGGQFNPDNGTYDRPGQPVQFDSLEMKREEVYERLYSQQSGVGLTEIMTGGLGEAARGKLIYAQDRMSTWPMAIYDESYLDVDYLRARTKRMKRTKGIVLAIVDYLQLLQSRKFSRDRYNEVSYVSRVLKKIAMENEIPVIALAQLNRKDADKEDIEPHVSHLRDSGTIEQDADKVILLHRHKAGTTKRIAKPGLSHYTAIVAKQRNGRQGRVDLDFYGYRMAFESADEWGAA